MKELEPQLPGFLNNDYVKNVLQQVEGSTRAILEGAENVGNLTLDVITGLLDKGLGFIGLASNSRSEGVALERGSTHIGDPHFQLSASLSPPVVQPKIEAPAISVARVQAAELPEQVRSDLEQIRGNIRLAMDHDVSLADLGTGIASQPQLPQLGTGRTQGVGV